MNYDSLASAANSESEGRSDKKLIICTMDKKLEIDLRAHDQMKDISKKLLELRSVHDGHLIRIHLLSQ